METAQDEHNQRGSTTSSGVGGGDGGGNGGRSSKKMKPKRIPQRGLGVAQLERIRLEEQQKKDSSIVNNIPSSPITTFPSSESLTNFHHNQTSSSSLAPFSPRRLIDVPSDDSLFKPPPITSPSVDKYSSSSTIPLASQINGGISYEIGWPLPRDGNASKLWSSEQGQVGENRVVDHQVAFRPSFSSESNHISSRPNVMQSHHHYPPVNVSTTSSSSILSYQMEPPSNQSYYGNYSHLLQEEEKILVGMNIPYTFPQEIPPCPSFHYKLPPFNGPFIRSGESTACDTGNTRSFYPSRIFFREAPSSSTSVSKSCLRDIIENRDLNGDFLTLAPPTTTTTASACTSDATFKHNSAYSSSCNQNLFEFELLPYRGPIQDPVRHHQPSGSFQPMYSFLPPAKTQNIPVRTPRNNVNGARDNIDLNLKL